MRYIVGCLIGFGATCFILWLLRPLAARIGLVDGPGCRKLHQGNVALVGGIAMFAAFALSIRVFDLPLFGFRSFLVAGALLVAVGVIDDLYELPSHVRFAAQITAALIMTVDAGVVVESLGAITGNGDVQLGGWAIPFTVFATVGVINALNMSDGIDGLAGGLSLIAFTLLAFVAVAGSGLADASVLFLLACIVGGFLLFNLQLPWRRRAVAFMGDAGSMFLGFALAWFAVSLSQGEGRVMTPVTALCILALPLIDTVSILIRRVWSGRSPFVGDRDHLHHILLAAGYTVTKTNLILWSAALLLGGIAVFAFYWQIPEHLVFYAFLGVSFFHLAHTAHTQKSKAAHQQAYVTPVVQVTSSNPASDIVRWQADNVLNEKNIEGRP